MRHDELAPRRQSRFRISTNRNGGDCLLLTPAHRIEALTKHFLHLLIDGRDLWRAHFFEQSFDRVYRAIGVVEGETLLVRPSVAHSNEFVHVTPLRIPQDATEAVLPVAQHDGKQCSAIPRLRIGIAQPIRPARGQRLPRLVHPIAWILLREFAHDILAQTFLQQVEAVTDAFVICDCHVFLISNARRCRRVNQSFASSSSSAPSPSKRPSSTPAPTLALDDCDANTMSAHSATSAL